MPTIKANRKIFSLLCFVLLPFFWLLLLIVPVIEYFKNNHIYSIKKTFLAFGFISLIPIVLSIIFLRYKLFFDDVKITYQNLLTRRTLTFDEIDYARFEHGYKDRSEKFGPHSRFVIYPKAGSEQGPLVINFGIFENFKDFVEKIEYRGKLKRTKSHTR